MIDIQSQMTERCVELLLLPEDEPQLLLDIGCGSGISGGVLSELGHTWIGFDISPAMLSVSVERETEGDLLLNDMGQGFKFRPGSFDGAVSVSAIQWLCNCDKKGQEPWGRLRKFFSSLFVCLRKGARCAFQFYPETSGQVEMITSAAIREGFGGGLVVDFPHSTKAKKHFLVIYAGFTSNVPPSLPAGAEEEHAEGQRETSIKMQQRDRNKKRAHLHKGMTTKEFIESKKIQQINKGKTVKKDSKFTGRRRGPHW